MGHLLSTPSRLSAPPPLHPALTALVLAAAHLQRAGRTADARAWNSWTSIIFDASDHSQALHSAQSLLPERMSIVHDVTQAEKWLHIAGKELFRNAIMDAHELFLVELGEYFDRKHECENHGDIVFKRGEMDG